jgi:hypothetical protein
MKHARLIVEMALQDAGESIKVDRLAIGLLAGHHEIVQLVAGDRVEFREQELDLFPFRILANAIGIHDMVHQGGGGDAWIVSAAGRLAFHTGRQILQERQHTFEHGLPHGQ